MASSFLHNTPLKPSIRMRQFTRKTLFEILRSLILHWIILCFATVVFVYFLIFDRDFEKRLGSESESEKRMKIMKNTVENGNDQSSWQLVKYTGPPQVFQIDFAGKFYEISIRSGAKFDKSILKLGEVDIDPRIFSSPVFDPWDRFSLFKREEETENSKNKFAIISLQDQLLLRTICEFL